MYVKGLPVATAFIVLGLLQFAGWTTQPNLAYAWIIAGIVALIAGWLETSTSKK